MALSAAITWECNAGATAGNVNGGGFKAGATGIDYSKDTGAHLTITDLQSDGSGVVHSDLTPFDTDDVGNILHITAVGTGFTVGWYEVISVDASSPPNATLDRSPGASKTGGSAYLGGAMSLNSTLDTDWSLVPVAGNTIYIKQGSYTLGEAMAPNDGVKGSPIIIRGYKTTRDEICNGTDRPLINLVTFSLTIGGYSRLENIRFVGTTGNVYLDTANANIYNCQCFANCIDYSIRLVAGAHAIKCEASNPRGEGIQAAGSANIVGCYMHHCLKGVRFTTSGGRLYFSVISQCNTYAVGFDNTNNIVYGNTLIGSSTPIGTGISIGTNYGNHIINNIIYGFVAGLGCTAADLATFVDGNNFYNNTADSANLTLSPFNIFTDPALTNAEGTLVEDCEDAWNEYVDADVTSTAEGTTKLIGTNSAKAACAAGLGAGDIIMTEAIASTNMSSWLGLGFLFRSSIILTAGDVQLLVSDQANRANILEAFNIPTCAANTWYWFYWRFSDPSGMTAIISIGLKQVVDKGAMNLFIDDVRAVNSDFSLGAGSGALNTGINYPAAG